MRSVPVLLVLMALGWLVPARAGAEEAAPALTFSRLVLRLHNEPEIGLVEEGYRVHILEYLRSAGYNSVGAENLVFDTDNSHKAEYALGGTIQELECFKPTTGLPSCRVGIEWQLMHMPTETVVYKALARHAEYNIPSLEDGDLGRRLVLGAVRRLLLRKNFGASLNVAPRQKEVNMPPAHFARCMNPAPQLPAQVDLALQATGLIDTGDGFASGVFINHQGYMLTAAHAVGHSSLKVRTTAQQSYPVTVLRVSEKYDVALLRVLAQTDTFPCLPVSYLAPSAGADVFVLGSPAGEELAFSVSKGIVSGLRVLDGTELVQTDASVNPGNSGGPMVAANGHVLALTSFKIAGSAFEGLAFGVPTSVALTKLGLKEAEESSEGLATPVSVVAKVAQKTLVEAPDPMPELDLEAVARREEAERRREEEERRAEERERQLEQERKLSAMTPTYVKALKIAGYVATPVGGAWALVSFQRSRSTTQTRAQYDTNRLHNDLAWSLTALGAASMITGWVLTPELPAESLGEDYAESYRGTVSIRPKGLGGLDVEVTF